MNEKQKRVTREPKKLYEDKIISIGKVTKVTQGGRNFRFSFIIVLPRILVHFHEQLQLKL